MVVVHSILLLVGVILAVFIVNCTLNFASRHIFKRSKLASLITSLLTMSLTLSAYFAIELRPEWFSLKSSTLVMTQKSLLVVGCFLMSHFFTKACNVFLWQGLFVSKGVPMVTKLVVRVFNFLVYFFTALAIIKIIYKTDIMEIMLASGVFALVVGYGAQSTLSNIFSGIALNIVRNVMPGDWVRIDGFSGQVINLDWRSITIEDYDSNKLVIPNSVFAQKAYVNFRSDKAYRRVEVPVKMPYSLRPGEATEILRKCAVGCMMQTKNHDPGVHLVEYQDNAMLFIVEIYTCSPYGYGIKNAVLSAVYYSLMRRNMSASPVRQYNNTLQAPALTIDKEDIKETFSMLKTYQLLKEELRESLMSNMEVGCYAPNEVLIQPGIINQNIYIIHQGELDILHVDEDGQEIRITTLEKGRVVGEMGTLLNEVAKYRVRAIGEVIVLKIPREAIRDIVAQCEGVLDVLLKVINKRKAQSQEKVQDYNNAKKVQIATEKENSSILSRLKMILRD